MRRTVFPAVAAASVAFSQIYVDPVGGDDASLNGSLDAPFKTIPRAQAAVRTLLDRQRATNTAAPIDVILRGGTYVLSSTLDFGPQDSGLSPASPVSYKPYCDPLHPSDVSISPFPYVMGASTPLRYLWNGMGNASSWHGPDDPLLQLGVNPQNRTLPPKPAWSGSTDTCVDKVGVGHTCYSSTMAPCVQNCMRACQRNVDKRVYSDAVCREFLLLFGRDLTKEEECVETCSVSCTTCDKVTISSMHSIVNGSWTPYTPPPTWHQPQAPIYVVSLSTLAMVDPPSELYLNGMRLPRASAPNVLFSSNDTTWTPQYAPVVKSTSTGRILVYNATTLSQKSSHWTNLASAQVDLVRAGGGNTRHGIYRMSPTTIDLDAGGGQMNGDEYFGGPAWASVNGFRVENVFEELDAPGEWYYDTTTSELYMIPPRGVIPTEATIEFPRLKQLVRVRGTPGIDVGYSEPSRDTMVTAAETETAHPASQALWASNLEFDGLEFTGTQRTDMELYETLPGHPWTQTRVGAIYIESAQDVRVEHCTFSKLGGNAIFVSGRTERIHVVLNHFTQIGATAVAIVAKSVAPHDPTHARQFLHSRRAIVSYNQMHDYGLVTRQSAAVLVVGTSQTTVYGNLVFAIPTGGVSYSNANANADGALSRLLVRPLDTPVQLVETLAPELGGLYTTRLNLGRLDRVAYPLQAKIIGGPECAPAQGRVGSLYGQQHAGCSDCCLTTHGTAGIRNSALGISAFTLQVPVEPTNVLDIQVQSAMYFDAPVDVHVGFHLVTPNRLVELPTWRVHWRVRTRFCVEQSSQQTVACAGPCGCHVAAGVVNMPPCPAGFDVQPTSLACLGPSLFNVLHPVVHDNAWH
ncbi:hypothetical protein, variant 1 [Aphanomyces invadans]|uniref:Right handed beta helix domain-containing protein n=1 Tax=Aphanomyces invadans TaxID=157072 RepID=A0A024UT99_9STRA|nr:hypothetical protein, variant 1 [Aphanomyces invadans]ETW09569.1 hypothetical protein, variant 1 [Aphanomyces invadans]|eukprot:XP_008860980.1 hypothetical protein, variant 1 [Aphanomyces invadans]